MNATIGALTSSNYILNYLFTHLMEIATFMLAVCTFWMAVIARRANKISEQTLKSIYKPNVIVHIEQGQMAPTLLYLVIENFGNAPAHDIKFSSSIPIPHRAVDDKEIKYMTSGPIIQGIPFMSPNSKFKILWGRLIYLEKALNKKALEIRCTFKNQYGEMIETLSVLEVSCLMTIDAAREPLAELATQIRIFNKDHLPIIKAMITKKALK